MSTKKFEIVEIGPMWTLHTKDELTPEIMEKLRKVPGVNFWENEFYRYKVQFSPALLWSKQEIEAGIEKALKD